MCILSLDGRYSQSERSFVVCEQDISHFFTFQVAAFHQYGPASQSQQLLCGHFHFFLVAYRHTGKKSGFVNIRGNQCDAVKKFFHNDFDGFIFYQLAATCRDHNRIENDFRRTETVDRAGYDPGCLPVMQHPDLDGIDCQVLEYGMNLSFDDLRGNSLYSSYPLCVLGRDRCNG